MRRLSVPKHQKNTNQSPKEGLVKGLSKGDCCQGYWAVFNSQDSLG